MKLIIAAYNFFMTLLLPAFSISSTNPHHWFMSLELWRIHWPSSCPSNISSPLLSRDSHACSSLCWKAIPPAIPSNSPLLIIQILFKCCLLRLNQPCFNRPHIITLYSLMLYYLLKWLNCYLQLCLLTIYLIRKKDPSKQRH